MGPARIDRAHRRGYRTISEEARRRHLPLLVDTASMVEAGGLFTVVPSAEGIGQQAAALVTKILDGAAPRAPGPGPRGVCWSSSTPAPSRPAELPFDRLLLDFVDMVIE